MREKIFAASIVVVLVAAIIFLVNQPKLVAFTPNEMEVLGSTMSSATGADDYLNRSESGLVQYSYEEISELRARKNLPPVFESKEDVRPGDPLSQLTNDQIRRSSLAQINMICMRDPYLRSKPPSIRRGYCKSYWDAKMKELSSEVGGEYIAPDPWKRGIHIPSPPTKKSHSTLRARIIYALESARLGGIREEYLYDTMVITLCESSFIETKRNGNAWGMMAVMTSWHREKADRHIGGVKNLLVARHNYKITSLLMAESVAQGLSPFHHWINGGNKDTRRCYNNNEKTKSTRAILRDLGIKPPPGLTPV